MHSVRMRARGPELLNKRRRVVVSVVVTESSVREVSSEGNVAAPFVSGAEDGEVKETV